jgi:hypothetical protein
MRVRAAQVFQIPRPLFDRMVPERIAGGWHGLRKRRLAGRIVAGRLGKVHHNGAYDIAFAVAPKRDQATGIQRFNGGSGTRSDAFRPVE